MPYIVTLEDSSQCGYLSTGIFVWQSSIQMNHIGVYKRTFENMLPHNLFVRGYVILSEKERKKDQIILPNTRVRPNIEEDLFIAFDLNSSSVFVHNSPIIAFRETTLEHFLEPTQNIIIAHR